MTTWTAERIETLKAGMLAGWSYGELGIELGCTRHAVRNKAGRLGLDSNRPMPFMLRGRSHAPKTFAAKIGPAEMPAPINVPILETDREHCRWIEGEPCGAQTLCCGQPITFGSWCDYHNSIGRREEPRK